MSRHRRRQQPAAASRAGGDPHPLQALADHRHRGRQRHPNAQVGERPLRVEAEDGGAERRRHLQRGVVGGQRLGGVRGAEHVELALVPALGGILARRPVAHLDLAHVAARAVELGVGDQRHAVLAELADHERAVRDQRRLPVPVLAELLGQVLRPGIRGRRRQHVEEVVARLLQRHLQRVVVQRLGPLHVVEQEGGGGGQLRAPLPGVHEVVRGDRVAVAPAGGGADLEQVAEAVARRRGSCRPATASRSGRGRPRAAR